MFMSDWNNNKPQFRSVCQNLTLVFKCYRNVRLYFYYSQYTTFLKYSFFPWMFVWMWSTQFEVDP